METNQTTNDVVLKQESVGYLKSKINMQQGELILSSQKITLTAHKTGVGGFGLLGALLKSKVEKVNSVFDLEFKNISAINQGKHGLQKNVLEITDKQDLTYRMIVKDYEEWEQAIRQKM